jgi:hypothetical protein
MGLHLVLFILECGNSCGVLFDAVCVVHVLLVGCVRNCLGGLIFSCVHERWVSSSYGWMDVRF